MTLDLQRLRGISCVLVCVLGWASLAFPAAAQDGPTEIRAFDLRSIIASHSSEPTLPLGVFAMHAPGFYPSLGGSWRDGTSYDLGHDDDDSWIGVDTIVEIVERSLDRAAELDDVAMYVQDATMIVRADRTQLEVVRETLEMLERFAMQRVTVRAVVLEGDGGATLETGVLDRATCESLVAGRGGARVLGMYEGDAGPFDTLVLGESREHVYVGDYEVEVAQDSAIAYPRMSVMRTGRQITVRADRLQRDRIGLMIGIERVDPVLPFRRVVTRAERVGELELPELFAHRAGMSVTVPNGGGVLTELGTDGAYVLVTAKIESSAVATSSLAWFPLGFLSGIVADFSFRTKSPSESAYRVGGAWVSDSLLEEGDHGSSRFLSADAIVDLLVENVTRGVDDATEEVSLYADEHLLVAATPERHAQVSSFLSGLEALRDRNVAMRFELFEATGEAVDALHRRRAAGGSSDSGWMLGSDAARELRRALGEPLGRASLTTLHGTGAAVFAGEERAVLRDYDVEIAQESAIADPNVDHHYDGLVLNVKPIVHQSGDRMTVRLDGEIARLHLRGSAESFGAAGIGGIDLPEKASIPISGALVLQSGQTRALLLQADDDTAYVLLVRGDLGTRR